MVALAPERTGTDPNLGITAKRISIIQMLLAWETVIMGILTLVTTQDIIKVILARRTTSIMISAVAEEATSEAEDFEAAALTTTLAAEATDMDSRATTRAKTRTT